MKYRLVHLTGGLAGRVRDLDAEEVVLGRDPHEAQVVFPADDGTVSRRHALLRVQDGRLLLRDLDSSTGTFVDGHDVEEAELADGDVFALGAEGPRLRVEMAEGGTLVVDRSLLPARPAPPAAAAVAGPLAPVPAGPVPGPDSRLRLTFVTGTRAGASVELAGAVLRIGRAEGSSVWTPSDRIVSAQHAKIVRLQDGYVVIDLESRNGTYLNGQRIERSPLRHGDVLGLGPGGPEMKAEILAPARAASSGATVVIPRFEDLAARRQDGVLLQEVTVGDTPLLVGRAEEAGLRLDSPIVSREHARFTSLEGALSVQDLDSSNGTFVDGTRTDRATVADGARVVIGPFVLVVTGAGRRLQVLDTRHRARLEARAIGASAQRHTILRDISLTLPPGSFTAIIGPSGAGKSTLLSALSGARPAQQGQVLLNGADLYREFAALKASVGYVPQDDLVHRELTVAQSLDYTARLRLPPDTTPEERARRVAQVLATLELTERADAPIHRLSGGQRKRVSIASELLTEPTLLFLDEPTSGLDPGLEEALMLLLRELSYKGKSVVLVTHTLDNIHLCDAVVLLVDGRLAFHGPAAEARKRFGIEHMVNLYARLKEKTAEQWQAEFSAPAGSSVPVSVSVPAATWPRSPATRATPGCWWPRRP